MHGAAWLGGLIGAAIGSLGVALSFLSVSLTDIITMSLFNAQWTVNNVD